MSEDAVTETDEANETSEDTDAQDDLDTLLKTYEESESEEKKDSKEQPDNVALLEELRRERQEREAEKTQKDLQNAVDTIKEHGVDIPDKYIRGALYDLADTDPRFSKAWVNRSSNPRQFNKVLKTLAKELKDDFLDKDLTDTKNDVVSAVKGASKEKGSEEMSEKELRSKILKMNDQEFEKYKRDALKNL